jgi:nucleotide-binding universal stress UspA family protein
MAYPFKKILCPIDFDPNSIAALDIAAELARQSNATVVVLHVVPIIIHAGGAPIYIDVYPGLEQESAAKLQELANAHLTGVTYELRTNVAEPSVAILHAQKATGAEVIVMSTHGRRGLSHLFLGSVAERVVREAPCPVLTIRPHRASGESATASA